MIFTPSNQSIAGNQANRRQIRPRSFSAFATAALVAAFSLFSVDIASCQEATPSSTSAKAGDGFAPLAEHWKECSFGGDGAVYFTNSKSAGLEVEMFQGDPLTGIRWTGEFPKQNYELRFQGRRMEGFDFFAAVTFPVGKEFCSFVLGGWGGGMVGISSIDGADASANETTQYKEFETKKWYTIRVRVDEMRVRCWIDDVEYADVARHKHELSIRLEMDPCLPMGIANYMTRTELRKIELRKLTPADSSSDEDSTETDSQSVSEQAAQEK